MGRKKDFEPTIKGVPTQELGPKLPANVTFADAIDILPVVDKDHAEVLIANLEELDRKNGVDRRFGLDDQFFAGNPAEQAETLRVIEASIKRLTEPRRTRRNRSSENTDIAADVLPNLTPAATIEGLGRAGQLGYGTPHDVAFNALMRVAEFPNYEIPSPPEIQETTGQTSSVEIFPVHPSSTREVNNFVNGDIRGNNRDH